MEIEKKRETSWKIDLKKKDEYIELTSVEISGVVRIIKLAIVNKDNSVKVEMNKEEFYNFLSLISAFKDVVIGEDSIIIEEDLNLIQSNAAPIQEGTELNNEIYQVNSEPAEEYFEDDEDMEKLDPEEWDPW
jgi:hypothetical protein